MQQITITDASYTQWIEQLSQRYRQSQVKAAIKVNSELLRFYWSLGRDIALMKAEARWGSKFMKNLSCDLKRLMPDAACFSETNILYMKNFYLLFPCANEITPQPVEQLEQGIEICPQPVDEFVYRLV